MSNRRKARLYALAGQLFGRQLVEDEGSMNLARRYNRELRAEAVPLQKLIISYELIVSEVIYPASPSLDIDLQHTDFPGRRPVHRSAPLELRVRPKTIDDHTSYPSIITYNESLHLGTFNLQDTLTAYILPALQKEYRRSGSKIPFSLNEEQFISPESREYPSAKVWVPRELEEFERALVIVKHNPSATYLDTDWLERLGLEYQGEGKFIKIPKRSSL